MLAMLLLITAIASAVTDWAAVAKGWAKTETIAKPTTMVLLFSYLAVSGGFEALPLIFISLGVLFSLAGDIFLLVTTTRTSNRWFLLGLASFLFAHIAYIIGLNILLGNTSPMWTIIISIVLVLLTVPILWKIISGACEKGMPHQVGPVIAYGTVITLMVLSAITTIFRVDWKTSASVMVCLGALLFFFSDIILAWNKFVNPIKNGRVINMVAYHLGQILLVAGAVVQYGHSFSLG